jgi:hypothetical protein
MGQGLRRSRGSGSEMGLFPSPGVGPESLHEREPSTGSFLCERIGSEVLAREYSQASAGDLTLEELEVGAPLIPECCCRHFSQKEYKSVDSSLRRK